MPVKTRSQTKYQNNEIYEVDIDFDEASSAWKANKKSIGNGSYRYLCCKINKNNKNCIAMCLPGVNYCKNHIKMIINE